MGLQTTKSGQDKTEDSYFVFDTGGSIHSLGVWVGGAYYNVFGAVWDGDTAGLLRLVAFSRLVRGYG